jgi:hypothetical protein
MLSGGEWILPRTDSEGTYQLEFRTK